MTSGGPEAELVHVLQLGPWLDAELRARLEPRYRFIQAWRESNTTQWSQRDGRKIRAIVTHSSGLAVDAGLLQQLPNLEVVVNLSAGAETVDADLLARRGISLHTGSGFNAADVAELALGMVLMLGRNMRRGDLSVRAGLWPNRLAADSHRIHGRPLGIVGMGAIGKAIATRAEALGMVIHYCSRRRLDALSWRYLPSVELLAREVDFLIAALPGGAQTRHLIDRKVLDQLGPAGYLVNVSRGSVVDEEALAQALAEGRLAGAGLDVFEREPDVPPALRNSDRVVLQPHRGGATFEAYSDLLEFAAAALDQQFSGPVGRN